MKIETYCSEQIFNEQCTKEADCFLELKQLRRVIPLCQDCFENLNLRFRGLHPKLVSKEQYLMQEALE